MHAIQRNPSAYPLNVMPYVEVTVPYWDVATKVISVVCTPLRVISWLYSYATTSKKQYEKKEPPGAPGHTLLGSYPELRERRLKLLNFLADYHEKYGREYGICKVRLGLRTFYIVTDPKFIKNILWKPKSFVRGPSLQIWQKKFSPGGLSEGRDTLEWRKQAENAIGHAIVPYYFPGMAAIAGQWMERLGKYAMSSKPFDLMYEAERAALATIGETLFKNDSLKSHRNPFGLNPEDDERCTAFLGAFHNLFELLSTRMTSGLSNVPLIGDKVYSAIYTEEEAELEKAKATLKKILEPIFKSVLEGKIDKGSHLYMLLVNFGIDLEKPDYDKILDQSLGFLQASFETSSKALGWTLYHLARDQDLQERLRKNLFSVFSDRLPKDLDDLREVPLLSQVMEETLRMFPPFPVLVRDINNPEDFEEFRVEKGGTFLISPYLIHRNAKEWEDPATFKPSRFKVSETKSENMLEDIWQKGHHQYATFLGGLHRCPGRHFGKQEILINVAHFLMRYKIALENPHDNEPVELKFCITLQPREPIKVKISPIEIWE